MKKTSSEVVKKIALIEIDGPDVDQRLEVDPDEIKELAESIEELGLMQPILLTPKNGRFEIVWGHRRFLAHKYLGRVNINAKIQEMTKSQKIIMRATENIHRKDITAIEEALIYSDLKNNHEMSYEQISKRMRKSPGLVRRRLDLLRMPEVLQNAIHKKMINYAVAEDLWVLGDVSAIEYYLQFCIEHGSTSAVVRQWVKDEKDKKRRQDSGIDQGGGDLSPSEERPVYVACEMCFEAMEIGTEKIFRACKTCTTTIMKSIRER